MDNMGAIVGVTVTACVTIMGWYIANYLTTKREDGTRKAETRKKYLERQIEEFYGPLFNLAQQVESVVEIRSKILGKKWEIEHKDTNNAEIVEIRRFLRVEFLQPLYAEMRKILREKLYLLDASEMPQSFKDFLSQVVQNEAQHRLWVDKNISTINIQGTPYPENFSKDIATSLARLTDEYRLIQGHPKLMKDSPSLPLSN
jgi:hypothetical protein